MRLTQALMFLLLFFSFLTGQRSLHAQKPDFRLTADYDQRPLTDVLNELEERYSLTFSYLANTLEDKIISRSFREAAWPEVENYLFKHHGIEVKTLPDGYVVLTTLPPGSPLEWDICLRLTDESGVEMPFVTAALTDGSESFYSGDDGWCRRTITARPNDSLSFDFLGYRRLRVAVSDAAGARCPVFAMAPSGIELASVEVIEYLTGGVTSSLEGREVTLKPGRLTALPGFTEKEVYRSAQLLPGINSPDESAGKLSIRGGAPDQTQIIWDGINVYASGHYFGMISFFSPDLIDEMRIWRGQAKADYGGRLSGLVEMSTSRAITPRPVVGASLNLTHADAYAKVPLIKGKSDLHVSARSALAGPFGNLTYQSFRRQVFQNSPITDISLGPSGEIDSLNGADQNFNFNEVNARWQWNPNPNSFITVSGFSQTDEFTNVSVIRDDMSSLSFSEAVNTRNDGLSATFKRLLRGGSSLSLQASGSAYENDNTLGVTFEFQGFMDSSEAERGSTIGDLTLKADYVRPTYKGHILKAGLQLQRLSSSFLFTAANPDGQIDARQEPFSGNNAAVYGSYTLSARNGLRTELGLRLQYYVPTGAVYAEPRLTAVYKLDKHLRLKGGFGINHQFFNEIVELDFDQLSGITPLWAMADGDETLVSSAKELTGGFLWQKKGWMVDAEAYRKRIDNFSSLDLLGSADDQEDIFNGASRSTGLDLLLKKRWNNFSSWAIYTVSKTEWRFAEIAPDFFPAANDRRHQFKWVNSYETNRWLFSLGWQYRTGNRFSPSANNGPIIAPDGVEPNLILREGLNAGVLPAFHRLDLSAFYRWRTRPAGVRGLHGKVGLSFLNVYNRKNTNSRSFRLLETFIQDDPFGPGHRAFFVESIDRFGLGFTPNLSVSFGWK